MLLRTLLCIIFKRLKIMHCIQQNIKNLLLLMGFFSIQVESTQKSHIQFKKGSDSFIRQFWPPYFHFLQLYSFSDCFFYFYFIGSISSHFSEVLNSVLQQSFVSGIVCFPQAPFSCLFQCVYFRRKAFLRFLGSVAVHGFLREALKCWQEPLCRWVRPVNWWA